MMQRLLWMFLLLFAATTHAQSGAERAAAVGASLVGKPVPALRLHGLDGRDIDVGAYRGKQAVYLKFWATWCQPCIEQMPHFQHAYETAGASLAVIGINAGFNDTPEVVKQFQREHHVSMPMAIDDGSAAAALNLRVTPMHVVIDRAGTVRYVGHLADERLDQALQAVKADATGGTTRVASANHLIKYTVGSSIRALQLQPLDAATKLQLPAAGRPSVLVFISTWCESYLADSRPEMSARCKRAREQLTTLPVELTGRAQWVWIASGLWTDTGELRSYRDKHHIEAPLVLDSTTTLLNTFDVHEVPAVLVIDAKGVLRRRLQGDEADLAKQVRSALGE